MANKSFMMKAYNRLYTLEFNIDPANRITTVNVVDAETERMGFFQRFRVAAGILFGNTKIADLVFPLNLRSSDFYNMSFIYRPEKKVEVKAAPLVDADEPAKPKTRRPGRPRSKKTKEANS